VGHQSAEMLELLQHKNIGIGTRLEVKKHFDFDHSVEIRIKTNTITISEQLAKNIFVTYEF
jgi:DtxR family Mn-dependent transcriptional regulator